MKNITIAFILLTLIISFISCEKAQEKEDPKPTVVIHKPTENMMYHSGDTIWVKVELGDSDELHEYKVAVKNTTDNLTVIDLHGHVHGTNHQIDTYLVATVSKHTDFLLEATAINHNSIETTKELNFSIH